VSARAAWLGPHLRSCTHSGGMLSRCGRDGRCSRLLPPTLGATVGRGVVGGSVNGRQRRRISDPAGVDVHELGRRVVSALARFARVLALHGAKIKRVGLRGMRCRRVDGRPCQRPSRGA
jgi:hypothetical protein